VCLASPSGRPLTQAKGETVTVARVLIVEDERLIAQALGRRVAALGYAVVGLAAFGEDATVQATALQPDAVLMDIGLRGALDGIDAVRHIRAQAPIPLVYVSASTHAPTVARAWQSAPAGHLVKPVSHHALHATLLRVLGDPPAPEDEVLTAGRCMTAGRRVPTAARIGGGVVRRTRIEKCDALISRYMAHES
jgi:CheY-like chemotaxis protein